MFFFFSNHISVSVFSWQLTTSTWCFELLNNRGFTVMLLLLMQKECSEVPILALFLFAFQIRYVFCFFFFASVCICCFVLFLFCFVSLMKSHIIMISIKINLFLILFCSLGGTLLSLELQAATPFITNVCNIGLFRVLLSFLTINTPVWSNWLTKKSTSCSSRYRVLAQNLQIFWQKEMWLDVR